MSPSRATTTFHTLVAMSGLPWLLRETVYRSRPTVVCMHDPRPGEMRDVLAFLKGRYSPVTLSECLDWFDGNGTLPPKPIVITLDDGWAGNAELEDVFAEYGVRPTIFVCTGIVGTSRRFWSQAVPDSREREGLKGLPDAQRVARLRAIGFDETAEVEGDPAALSEAQLQAVAQWADVQSHSRLHPILPRCDDERAWAEIDGSRQDLEAALGFRVYALAYPNGDFGPREMRMTERAGFACAVTVEAKPVSRHDDRYALPRVFIREGDRKADMVAALSGLHRMARRLLGGGASAGTPL